ncbi:hypothetical protein ACLMJK_000581 [Lecanora helva]
MHFTTPLIALATTLLSAPLALACCREGCYSVKGEAFTQAQCGGDLSGASIANYGNIFSSAAGNCVDISGDASLKAHNDGCGSSHPDFHFFKQPGCPGGSTGGFMTLSKRGGGECFDKPDGAVSMLVVSV